MRKFYFIYSKLKLFVEFNYDFSVYLHRGPMRCRLEYTIYMSFSIYIHAKITERHNVVISDVWRTCVISVGE